MFDVVRRLRHPVLATGCLSFYCLKRAHMIRFADNMAKIAIIETGGKQYLVMQDSVLSVEKLPTAKDGKITFEKVLLIDDGKDTEVGAPYISGAKVSAEVVEEGRAKKVVVIRYREKSRYFKKRGHRQPFTKIRITAL